MQIDHVIAVEQIVLACHSPNAVLPAPVSATSVCQRLAIEERDAIVTTSADAGLRARTFTRQIRTKIDPARPPVLDLGAGKMTIGRHPWHKLCQARSRNVIGGVRLLPINRRQHKAELAHGLEIDLDNLRPPGALAVTVNNRDHLTAMERRVISQMPIALAHRCARGVDLAITVDNDSSARTSFSEPTRKTGSPLARASVIDQRGTGPSSGLF